MQKIAALHFDLVNWLLFNVLSIISYDQWHDDKDEVIERVAPLKAEAYCGGYRW